MLLNPHPLIKTLCDVTAGSITLATVVGWLPALAAGFTLLYTITRLIIEWPNLKAAVAKWFS